MRPIVIWARKSRCSQGISVSAILVSNCCTSCFNSGGGWSAPTQIIRAVFRLGKTPAASSLILNPATVFVISMIISFSPFSCSGEISPRNFRVRCRFCGLTQLILSRSLSSPVLKVKVLARSARISLDKSLRSSIFNFSCIAERAFLISTGSSIAINARRINAMPLG